MIEEHHETTIEAPPADVWGFVVDPAALSAWFGAEAWLDPEVDGQVRFRFADGSVRRGHVDAVDLHRSLTWSWREHRGTGFGSSIGTSSTVRITLEPVEAGTRVLITETSGDEPARSPSDAAPRRRAT